jgi:hypothetical protein
MQNYASWCRNIPSRHCHDLNVANAYLNVAQTRAHEAMRRGLTVYDEKRIPKKGMETIFSCEPSGLRQKLPSRLKAPLPIASCKSARLLEDLQNRGSIVFCDRFFDATGNQIQDMQVLEIRCRHGTHGQRHEY